MVLRGLRVGDATVTLRFWRDEDGASNWEVLHQQGTLHIVRQPAPESLSARGRTGPIASRSLRNDHR